MVVFSPIFVANTKIIYRYNFVAPSVDQVCCDVIKVIKDTWSKFWLVGIQVSFWCEWNLRWRWSFLVWLGVGDAKLQLAGVGKLNGWVLELIFAGQIINFKFFFWVIYSFIEFIYFSTYSSAFIYSFIDIFISEWVL